MKIATLPPEPDGAGGAAGVRKDWGRSCRHHLLMTRAGRANERRTLKQMMLPIAAEKVGRETHTPRTGRFAGAWLIVSGLSKPRGQLFNQSRTSRSSVRPASPTHSYAVFKGDRWEECVQMPGKMARSDPRPRSGLPVVLAAVVRAANPLGKTPDIRKNLRSLGVIREIPDQSFHAHSAGKSPAGDRRSRWLGPRDTE